ncbi:hypothetical protein M0R45_032441 [Rubus argutus]|uniref:Cullin family profile domain-containing protein n=1 Tax=Rubus argutus TaxID=59490 RepID=A0AAW1WH93_RUBAR
MSALTACCDESITEERNGDSRGWLARTVGKGKHATPGGGSTECLACGKRGHTVDTCFRIHKCQICGKHGHLTSTCYQNLEYMSHHVFPQNRSLSSIGSSLKCQICSKKGHTAAKCFYRADVPADHPSLFIPTCQICGLKGHTAAKCFYRADVKLDHPSLFIPTCQICGLKCHVALNCPHRTTFAYQVSESPTSLTALTALSAESYNSNHTESQGGYTCFPGGFRPNNGASNTSVINEVWISDSQRIPIPGAVVHLSQLPTELMRDHNSAAVVSTRSDDSAGTRGNGNNGNTVGSHNGEENDDYDSGSNSAGSENASNHGCNSDFVDGSHVVTCEEDNIHILNATIQGEYVGSIDLHDSKVGDQVDDSNADINGGQNSLAFNNDNTFQKALNSSFEVFINLIALSPDFISLFVDDMLQKGLRGVSEEDVEVVLDKQHLAKQLLSSKTVSDVAERSLILKLKTVCGYQFTSKLTGADLSNDMTGDAYTMKKLKKLEMLQRDQVEHVKAERNPYTWERAHMGIFTELGVLYARYRPEKLMDNPKLVSASDVIIEEVKNMAEAIAEEWKPKLNIFDMVVSYGNSLEAHAFLQLLATWDYSTWIRSYALFLEERLECCRVLKFDVEMDRPRTKDLNTAELLEHLPALQQFLFRVLGCQPLGALVHNFVAQLGLSMVALESIKVYQAISDGTVNLVDKFFEMQRNDALKALDIY